MRLLLDTHALIWWLVDYKALSKKARQSISTPTVSVFVSPANIWEIEIKAALGKLEIPPDIEEALDQSDFQELPISIPHVREAARLPLHHQDPFDRLLIGQARIEQLTLVTRDPAFKDYDVSLMLA